MLISIEDLKAIYTDKDFSKFSDERLKRKLEAIESMVREETHNNFINRATGISCYAQGNVLHGDFSMFSVGDTIQIFGKVKINDGIYVVEAIEDGYMTLNKMVYDYLGDMNIYKVEYPTDLIDGCIELLDYDCNTKANLKRGIASESISRHSVSYVQYNSSNSKAGYPIEMLDFLTRYKNWLT